MILYGRVTDIDTRTGSGIITCQQGRDFLFLRSDCHDETLPPIYSTVTFLKDRDYKTTNVAHLVKVDQYSSALEQFIDEIIDDN